MGRDGENAGSSREATWVREALASLLDGRLYDEISLADVLARAGVDQATFDRSFDDLDEVFMAVWTEAEQAYIASSVSAVSAQQGWLDGIRAAAWETCRFMQEDHRRARILMFKLEAGADAVRAQRDQLIQLYVDVVHNGRFETGTPEKVSRDVAAGITDRIWERLDARVSADEFDRLPEDVPGLLHLTVLPYLGTAAAARELERGRIDLARFRAGKRG